MLTKFPADRTIFFSDAVFAIAITLLILEIPLPTADEVRTSGIPAMLASRIPNFIGFTISFVVTALFWRGHLQTCAYAVTITNRFVWLNLCLLFFVVIMPFTTALYSNFGFNSNTAFGLYSTNLALIGLFNYLILLEVIKTEGLRGQTHPLSYRWHHWRTLTVPIVFFLCVVMAPLLPMLARYGFLAIFIVHAVGDRVHKRRLARASSDLTSEIDG